MDCQENTSNYMYKQDYKPACSVVDRNVSEFIRKHASRDTDIATLNTFIQNLDKHIHIDANDPKFNHIYCNIDIIVTRLVSELAKADSYFTDTKLRPTGSIYCGVKVGLPHEADYLMEVPEHKTLDTGKKLERDTLFKMAVAITKQKGGHIDLWTYSLGHTLHKGTLENRRNLHSDAMCVR